MPPTIQPAQPIRPYVAVPSSHGNLWFRTAESLEKLNYAFPNRVRRINLLSLLPFNFNTLYADALNRRAEGVTHFIMLHDDVAPQGDQWGQQLLLGMMRHNLACLSCNVAIKSDEGYCSTAIDTDDPFEQPQKFKIGDIVGTRTTLTEPRLLINTGCMAIDLNAPGADRLYFRFKDTIRKDREGKFEAWTQPEDWELSRQMRALGMPFGATSDIKVLHQGGKAYANWTDQTPRPT